MIRRKKNRQEKGKLWTLVIAGLIVGIFSLISLIIGDYAGRKWDGKTRFTLVNLKEGGRIESVDIVRNVGVRLTLPENTEVETIGGRGKWRLQVMPNLAEKFGVKWTADSIADFTGVAVTSEKSQMGWWDRFAWWKISRKVQWEDVDAAQNGWLKEVKSNDGLVVWELGPMWKQNMNNLFTDTQLIKDGLAVRVINTVSLPGMGTHAARWIESAGIRVNMIETAAESIVRCAVIVSGDDKGKSVTRWLEKIYDCEIVQDDNLKGEVVLKLGMEYQGWWKGLL
jgi:hypothetical protein